MPEGDTLFRTATVLRQVLAGKNVTAARGRAEGVALGRVVGSHVDRVQAQGKHLLIGFDNGLTLHTHLRMHGSWHRYRAGEHWQRSPSRAVAVIEVPGGVAVCFDAPTVELLDTRALDVHYALRALGPDLLAAPPGVESAVQRLQEPARATMTIAEALLDQTALAGLGNVYRSELLFIGRVDPCLPLSDVAPEVLFQLVVTGARLLRANVDGLARQTIPQPGAMSTVGPRGPRSRLWVYGRTDRPCRRCGTIIRATTLGRELPRRLYWCPACQPPGRGGTEEGTTLAS